MLSVHNFNPLVVETISLQNTQKPREINELKLDLRGEGDRGGSKDDDEDVDGVSRENV